MPSLKTDWTARADALFVRVGQDPAIPPVEGSPWRGAMTANAAWLPVPDPEAPDGGEMRLYLRGSIFADIGERAQIGLLTQPLDSFDPRGPWQECPANPLIEHGGPGAHDEISVLDTTPVVAPDGSVYIYYAAIGAPWVYSLGGAVSHDGGLTFEKFAGNPLKRHVGPCDVVFHEGLFYLFYGDAQWDEVERRNRDLIRIRLVTSPDPERFDFDQSVPVVSPGVNSWDQFSIGGGRIFELDGRWWMIYQGSDLQWDFPWRFGLAVSDDLCHWRKVEHPTQPLFTRGPAGAWDQGAIWHGEVLVWEGRLWMYYEGWGEPGFWRERNLAYYRGGRSRLGLASCSVEDFRRWVAESELIPATD